MKSYDVVVIGGGPAGIAASLAAYDEGAKVILIEREEQLGGILKQCIHDGFGIVRFQKKLSGPEYAETDMDSLQQTGVEVRTQTFVVEMHKANTYYILQLSSEDGIENIVAKTIVLATGCRERTARQIAIHGNRPVGIYTAGTAQYFVNRLGYIPCKKCVVLGSGDIGLIMARRLTLEGVEVVGVYEAKGEPSGLSRNIHQCLYDFQIPLYLKHTISRVFGETRVTGVEIAEVNERMEKIARTEQVIECDGLILSVGLLPENELAEPLGIVLDGHTKGPVVNQYLMTSEEGIYSCGNALHVNDLVDYVSEAGKIAGRNAARNAREEKSKKSGRRRKINYDTKFLYVVPQEIESNEKEEEIILYFRVAETMTKQTLIFEVGEKEILRKHYGVLRPPEMERIVLKSELFNGEVGQIVMKMVGDGCD